MKLGYWIRIVMMAFMVIGFWSGKVIAQDQKVDSMRAVLATAPMDTGRVKTLLALGDRVAKVDYAEGLSLLESAEALADSLQFLRGTAQANMQIGELQNNLGAFEQSILHSTRAYNMFASTHDTAGMARALNTLGLVQYGLKQYEKAIQMMNASAKLYAAIQREFGMFSARHNLGVFYMAMGDTLRSIDVYRTNLRLLQGKDYWNIYAATYNNLGNSFNPVTQMDSAVAYYRKALEYKYKAENVSRGSIGNTQLNLAGTYLKAGKLDQAVEWIEKARENIFASNEKQRMLEFYSTEGDLAYALGDFKRAAEAYRDESTIQDSLYGPQIAEQASRLEAAFQNERQQQEIALLNKEKALDESEKTRWQWISIAIAAGLITSLTLLTIVIYRSRERVRMYNLIQQKNAEIKHQQKEIVMQNEALSLQNQRLADLNREKDGLISIVAHDIRAPFNRSIALSELILSLGNLSVEQERYLEMIKKVSNDGGKLIQDLLELNSYEQNAHPIDSVPCDLRLLLEHSCHAFASDAASKNITITISGTSAVAKTDEKLLGRILDNLISNAVKFTPKGKSVHLSVEASQDKYWVVVRDEGPGINAADQGKMFQKFQRLSARPTGGESSTGLGLSIVRTLAERLGAKLVFESKMGEGTTFKVGLPMS